MYDGATLSQQSIALPPARLRARSASDAAATGCGKTRLSDAFCRSTHRPKYVPVVDVPEQKYTMFCDPGNPEVRQHEWDIVREIVTNYDVDGVVFDDRLRYAGQNADFGPRSRAAFEQVVGHPLHWPDDVFRISPYPGQDIIPGPYYQQWLVWRAETITSWLDEAARIVRSVRPQAQVAVYVGSWYGDYEKVGSNWAGPDFTAPYHWLTPEYQKTAYADRLDWLTTGCYYVPATVAEAYAQRRQPRRDRGRRGPDLQPGRQRRGLDVCRSVRAVLPGRPRPVRARHQSGHGFDTGRHGLRHVADHPVRLVACPCRRLRGGPAQAPTLVPGLLAQVRRQHAAQRAQGVKPPPLPSFVGLEGTGF